MLINSFTHRVCPVCSSYLQNITTDFTIAGFTTFKSWDDCPKCGYDTNCHWERYYYNPTGKIDREA